MKKDCLNEEQNMEEGDFMGLAAAGQTTTILSLKGGIILIWMIVTYPAAEDITTEHIFTSLYNGCFLITSLFLNRILK